MVVTWGTNTVHTFGAQPSTPTASNTSSSAFTFGATPAPSTGGTSNLFGTPTTASTTGGGGGLFGPGATPAASSSSTGLFGMPASVATPSSTVAPASGGGGLFGTAAAPAPGGGLFGSSQIPSTSGLFGQSPAPTGGFFGTPAPVGGLFGPSPAPTGGLFGSTPASGGLFGNTAPTPAPFGSPFAITSALPQQQQQQQQQYQVPAQAALQAHLDASARQEAHRVRSALEKLNAAYTNMPSNEDSATQYFVAVQYTDITQEQRQRQWLHALGTGGLSQGLGNLVAPSKPPHVSEADWYKAVVNNPEPENLMPMALVGADALQTRLSSQQSRATELARYAESIQQSLDTIKRRAEQSQTEIQRLLRIYDGLKLKILQTIRKVELARCMNQSLQPDEVKIMEKMNSLYNQVSKLRKLLVELDEKGRSKSSQESAVVATNLPDKNQLLRILKEHRSQLEFLTGTVQRDVRDVELMQQRVVPKLPIPTHLA